MADKYTDDDRKAMAKAGQAMSDGSYPIKDADDLDNAIHAVGRGGADHDAIRRHIIGRAKALGLSSRIPDNWGADGSLKGSSSQSRPDFELLKRRRGSMIRQRERRGIPFAGGAVELRGKPDGTGGTKYEFRGYASVFDHWFEMWDRWGDPFEEAVGQGGFSRTLSGAYGGPDVRFYIGHNDAGIALARTAHGIWPGTMILSQDSTGLETYAPDLDGRNSEVRNLASAIERGDMDGMSIGFVTMAQEWSPDYSQRRITDINLHDGDVSVVAVPANPAASGATMIPLSAGGGMSQRQPAAEGRAASHGPFSGTHSHAHPAFGSQGGDAGHEHEHSHDDDADHDHMHPMAGPNDRAAAGQHEQRAQDEIIDNGGPPDSNVAVNGLSDVKCPYTVKNGCGQMCSGGSKFCGNCGGPLYQSDGTLVLDDSGVIEAVESTGDANLLSLRLRLLELA